MVIAIFVVIIAVINAYLSLLCVFNGLYICTPQRVCMASKYYSFVFGPPFYWKPQFGSYTNRILFAYQTSLFFLYVRNVFYRNL